MICLVPLSPLVRLVDLTMEFYRRNYIRGIFLSSGVVRNPDYTMERLVRVAKDLRTVHRFNGYIHLKSIPGASRELVNEAGLYADRLSVNVEIPKEKTSNSLLRRKDHESVFCSDGTHSTRCFGGVWKNVRNTVMLPACSAGQSTQTPCRCAARWSGRHR